MRRLILFFVVMPCWADYSGLHTALEAAVNSVLPCAEIDLKRTSLYQVEDGEVSGMVFKIECVKEVNVPAPPDPPNETGGRLLTWQAPTKRQNGEAFDMCNDGSHYLMHCDSNAYVVDKCETQFKPPINSGMCKILAVDSSGAIGDWSSEVSY